MREWVCVAAWEVGLSVCKRNNQTWFKVIHLRLDEADAFWINGNKRDQETTVCRK